MSRLLGTQIFWTTVIVVPLVLAAMTIVGRLWSLAFPTEFRQSARFYLAPALGLATFVLIASMLGQHLPLGDTIVVPLVLSFILIVALRLDSFRPELVHQLIIIGMFGILCGTSLLAPLYFNGAINAHNDTFTYLAHSNWLQQNAFSAQISAEQVTPAGTQILLYQLHGFRMGASYLLAFFQALLNIRWSYDVYPAVVISAMSVCCLAIGFPIAGLLKRLPTHIRLALLALPSFSLGGLVFGANLGFLPQTVGLAVASGAVLATGAALQWSAPERRSVGSIVTAAFPIAVLLTAAIFAYSEMVPFLIAAFGLSGLCFAIWSGAWRNVYILGCAVALLTLLLSNVELIRAYHSLRTQASVVVGGPVEWSILSFVAHAIGIQAGIWDDQRFTYLGIAWGLILALVVLSNFRSISWCSIRSVGSLLIPALLLLFGFLCGLIYFRYAVASPFPVGTGQSWSQFKLMEWAHPFVAALVLAVLASFLAYSSRSYHRIVFVLLGMAALGSCYIGVLRTSGVIRYYGNVADLDAFYRDFRRTVFAACPLGSSVYLALGGPDLYHEYKFRQLASVYLADRDVRSDWRSDGYIDHLMPVARVNLLPAKGDCLVEPNAIADPVRSTTVIGPVRVGVFDGSPKFQIASVDGAYGLESDGRNWWRWVERNITFSFKPFSKVNNSTVALRFEYEKRQDQPLQLEVSDGSLREPVIVEVGGSGRQGVFDREIEVGRVEDLKISISSKAQARPLSDRDQRKAAFSIRNLSVSAVLN